MVNTDVRRVAASGSPWLSSSVEEQKLRVLASEAKDADLTQSLWERV